MNLLLKRNPSNGSCTIGTLFVDGEQLCYTLEDVVREQKVYAQTAIPAGRYRVQVTMSPRFKRMLPLLHDVPNYSGVRIHPGNTAEDTEGCILPGMTNPTPFSVGRSREAFELLMQKLEGQDEIWLTIENAQ